VIERAGSDISMPEVIAAADKKMRDKVVYHIHRLPRLGAVSSTLIRAYQPPLFTLGGILGGSYLVAEAVSVNTAVSTSSISQKDISSPPLSPPSSPLRPNNAGTPVAAKDAIEPVLTNSLQGVDPEVLAYMEKHELYFFSRREKRRRLVLRLLSAGAVCAAVSAGVILFRRTTQSLSKGS
jgi:hypothetical protein